MSVNYLSLEVHFTEDGEEMKDAVYFCQYNDSDKVYYNNKLKEIYTNHYYTKDSCMESLRRDTMGMFRDPSSTKSYKLTSIKKVFSNQQRKQEESRTLVDFQESFTLTKDANGDFDWNWV